MRTPPCRLAAASLVCFALTVRTAEAQQAPGLFEDFGSNAIAGFGGYRGFFHVGAVAATAVLVPTGVDYEVHRFFHEHPGYGYAGAPGAVIGSVGPLLVAGGLLLSGHLRGDGEMVGAGHAVLQSAAITLVYVTLLKFVTGRPQPDEALVGTVAPDVPSLSRTFRFGFYRGGVYWGWPSGHTAATMATASTLSAYYPDSTAVKLIGYGSVAYMIFSVSSFRAGGMHWFSDAIAASLFAYPIGSSIGANFRRTYDASNVGMAPVVAPGFVGISFGGAF